MYDLERIARILADIDRYLADLEKMKVRNADMGDERYYSLSMVMFALLNRVIDLGEEIVRANNFGMPATYRDIFLLLAKNKIISSELEKKLSGLVSLRNVLSHEYYNVSKETIFEAYKKTGVVSLFVKAVKPLFAK